MRTPRPGLSTRRARCRGYVTTADGHLVLFSMLCNNYTVANREIERVQDLLVATIAAARVGSGGDTRGR